jgi:hypothetical protein
MFQAIGRQVRADRRYGIYGLDYSAVLAYAQAADAVTPLFLDMLPEIEGFVLASVRTDDRGNGAGDDDDM